MPPTLTTYVAGPGAEGDGQGVLIRVHDGLVTVLWQWPLTGRQAKPGYACDGDHVWLVALADAILSDALEMGAAATELAEEFALAELTKGPRNVFTFERSEIILWTICAVCKEEGLAATAWIENL
jgi:hypothetical protein